MESKAINLTAVPSNKDASTASKKSEKQTHLHKQNKSLTEMPKLIKPEHLTVLYLYNNNINKIIGLNDAVNITSLYLQHNQIKIIENLNKLKKLKKLFLGHNQITVIENLEDNIHLEELHVEGQYLKKCDCVCFDPRTIFALSAYLHVINISQNNIKSIYSLMPLSAMRVFHACKNKLNEIEEILETVQYWYYLYEANFNGNPVTKKHRYRELLIGHTMRLNMLDGKQISPNTRTFIRNLEEEKKNKVHNKNLNLASLYPNLPTNFPNALQESVSSSIIKTGLSDLKVTSHIPWKKLPRRNSPRKASKRIDQDSKSTTLGSFPMNL